MRSNRTNSILPELERALAAGAAGQRTGTKLSTRVGRVAAIGATCLAFTGTALAATGVWNPPIGINTFDGPSTTSDTPVPEELIAELGVMRGEATDQDHSAAVEATLRSADTPEGVRPESVRYLGPAANGEATILFSAASTSPIYNDEEPVCVDRPMPEWSQSFSACFGLSQLLAGDAYETVVPELALYRALGGEIDPAAEVALAFGIVPDGVATVTAEFGDAPDQSIPVTNNYWELPVSEAQLSTFNGEAGVEDTVWHDADGNVIPQSPAG